MSIDLFGLAKSALGNDNILGQLAGAIGESPETTGRALDAGLPAILGGLLGKANSSGGVEDIFNAVKDNDGSILDNVTDSLFGENQSSLLSNGASLLAMIFGARQGGVLGSLANMAGMRNASGATRLLGMLAPMVMGYIGKQRAQHNLDADGVQRLLLDQKDAIADHLPAEMRESLGVADLFDAEPEAPVERSGFNVWPWLAAAAAVVLLVSYWPSNNERPVLQAEAQKQASVTNERSVTYGDVSIDSVGSELAQRLGDVATSLGSITDESSAERLTAKIGDARIYLDSLDVDNMTGTSRAMLGNFAAPAADKVELVAQRVYSIPGVQGKLEPILNPLLNQLRAI